MDIRELRNKIDEADRQLLEAFEARMRVSEKIAAYKKEQGLPVCDPLRETQKLDAAAAALPQDLRDYGRRLYQFLFQLSKEHQEEVNACGLLGHTLQHSYSPQIHKLLNETRTSASVTAAALGYAYRLFEVAPENLDDFLRSGPFHGLNVTMPYKKEVAKRCMVLSETAEKLGSVNTVVRRGDGSLWGDNTDYFGFAYLLRKTGVHPHGKRAVVLGSGGASVTACAVLEAQGALVKVISRTGQYHYGDPSAYADAQILVNTTPVGMYPGNGQRPIDLKWFPHLEVVLDIVYNPVRTALLMQAEELGIPCAGGLAMLVAQAWKSGRIFLEKETELCGPDEKLQPQSLGINGQEKIEQVISRIDSDLQNLVLIGMAGCGKTTLGRLAAGELGRPFFDSDEEIEKRTGMKPADYILSRGEKSFRIIETEVLAELGKMSGSVIATGGGVVTRPENYPLLHQNGRILWVQRSTDLIPTEGRPLSLREGAARLYEARKPLYARFADQVIENNGSIASAVQKVTEGRFFCHKKHL